MGYDTEVVVISFIVWCIGLAVFAYIYVHKAITSIDKQLRDIRANITHWKDYMRGEVRRLDKDQSALALELSKQRWERKQRR